jgi:hypothetical protein
MRAGQKVFLPLEASQARAGGNASIQEFVSALYDWHNTAPGRLNVSVWVNNTNIGGGQANGAQGPPEVQRWSAPVNLAANAYLKDRLGAGYGARLVGVKDMPKGASRLSLDFSSLLGPLFSMWLLQLILPVGVHTLVSEKEQHLRVMMKMQASCTIDPLHSVCVTKDLVGQGEGAAHAGHDEDAGGLRLLFDPDYLAVQRERQQLWALPRRSMLASCGQL